MWHRPICGEAHIQKLLALLNHSFWGVHIDGRKQSFTSWGVHITGRNRAFSSAVEKLSRLCPGTEYHHKRGHTSNILCRIQKNYHCQRCIKICQDITLQQGEQRQHPIARWTLGDFISTFNCLQTISDNHSFNRKLSKKLSNNLVLHRLSCLNRWGGLVCPSGVYWQSSNLSRSFGTSHILLTLSFYMECDAHSVVICKGVGSKQHAPLMRQFQGNHVRTNECVWHGQNVASPGWDGTSTGGQSRDWEWNQWRPRGTKQDQEVVADIAL